MKNSGRGLAGPGKAAVGRAAAGAGPDTAGSRRQTEKPKGEKKLKFSFKEQREWETIEDDITVLEEEIAGLETEMEQSASDYAKLNELMSRKEAVKGLLEEKMDRWMYLNELAEKIENQQV